MAYVTVENKKRIFLEILLCTLAFSVLFGRLIYIQVVKSEYYISKAYDQQTRERVVEAKRGTIYDSNGKVLAQSISTNEITVVPNSIKSEKKEEVARKLADVLELDYDKILSKITKNTSSVTISKNVNNDDASEILKYIADNDLSGINVDESTTRIYPYNSLMSQVLGFVGTDNQGLEGIEAYYDEDLSGTDGKIVGSTDGSGKETPFTNEQYVSPTDGYDLVLTVDATIQQIVEKYVKEAYDENNPQYVSCVVVRPKTGEVLAMATAPFFDLNDPFTPNTEALAASWDTMSSEERSNALYNMWDNKCISAVAEPGSSFKVVTAAAALEEGICDLDTINFHCSGYMQVSGWTIKCWRYPRTHGSESLRDGVMNSCNPVFMQIGLKLGVEKFCKYLDAFNLYSRTGIDLPGEAYSITYDKNSMTELDTAINAFGQGISISTIQTASNYCVIANGGKLITPYVVKEIKSSDGTYNEVTDSKVVKKVLSEETAAGVLSALETVVSIGTGKLAKVDGYRVAGKTATAEIGRGVDKIYMAGFAGIAPVSSPEIVVVMNIMHPTGSLGYQGSTLCAPLVGNIIEETLNYLDIEPDYSINKENSMEEKSVPNVTGMTVKDAREMLSQNGFNISFASDILEEETIKSQLPKYGASLKEGSSVSVATNEHDTIETVVVPSVIGKKNDVAENILKKSGLNVHIVGSGYTVTQSPLAGETVTKGTIVTIKCTESLDEE